MPEQHDSYDDEGYHKRCYCEKCKRTYDEWCKKNREHGHTTCKRRCKTICEIVCEKPKTTVTHWGYKKEYEGKWESFHGAEGPKNCDRCKKQECSCASDKPRREKRARRDHRERTAESTESH